jgi:hypothetical protein
MTEAGNIIRDPNVDGLAKIEAIAKFLSGLYTILTGKDPYRSSNAPPAGPAGAPAAGPAGAPAGGKAKYKGGRGGRGEAGEDRDEGGRRRRRSPRGDSDRDYDRDEDRGTDRGRDRGRDRNRDRNDDTRDRGPDRGGRKIEGITIDRDDPTEVDNPVEARADEDKEISSLKLEIDETNTDIREMRLDLKARRADLKKTRGQDARNELLDDIEDLKDEIAEAKADVKDARRELKDINRYQKDLDKEQGKRLKMVDKYGQDDPETPTTLEGATIGVEYGADKDVSLLTQAIAKLNLGTLDCKVTGQKLTFDVTANFWKNKDAVKLVLGTLKDLAPKKKAEVKPDAAETLDKAKERIKDLGKQLKTNVETTGKDSDTSTAALAKLEDETAAYDAKAMSEADTPGSGATLAAEIIADVGDMTHETNAYVLAYAEGKYTIETKTDAANPNAEKEAKLAEHEQNAMKAVDALKNEITMVGVTDANKAAIDGHLATLQTETAAYETLSAVEINLGPKVTAAMGEATALGGAKTYTLEYSGADHSYALAEKPAGPGEAADKEKKLAEHEQTANNAVDLMKTDIENQGKTAMDPIKFNTLTDMMQSNSIAFDALKDPAAPPLGPKLVARFGEVTDKVENKTWVLTHLPDTQDFNVRLKTPEAAEKPFPDIAINGSEVGKPVTVTVENTDALIDVLLDGKPVEEKADSKTATASIAEFTPKVAGEYTLIVTADGKFVNKPFTVKDALPVAPAPHPVDTPPVSPPPGPGATPPTGPDAPVDSRLDLRLNAARDATDAAEKAFNAAGKPYDAESPNSKYTDLSQTIDAELLVRKELGDKDGEAVAVRNNALEQMKNELRDIKNVFEFNKESGSAKDKTENAMKPFSGERPTGANVSEARTAIQEERAVLERGKSLNLPAAINAEIAPRLVKLQEHSDALDAAAPGIDQREKFDAQREQMKTATDAAVAAVETGPTVENVAAARGAIKTESDHLSQGRDIIGIDGTAVDKRMNELPALIERVNAAIKKAVDAYNQKRADGAAKTDMVVNSLQPGELSRGRIQIAKDAVADERKTLAEAGQIVDLPKASLDQVEAREPELKKADEAIQNAEHRLDVKEASDEYGRVYERYLDTNHTASEMLRQTDALAPDAAGRHARIDALNRTAQTELLPQVTQAFNKLNALDPAAATATRNAALSKPRVTLP